MAVPAHSPNNRHTDNWWLEDIAASLAAGTSGSAGGQYNATPPADAADGASTTFQTDAKGNQKVVGNSAAGATDSGAPVKVGGVYKTALPTLTDGQRGDAAMTAKSQVQTVIMDAAGNNRGANVSGAGALVVYVDGGNATGDLAFSNRLTLEASSAKTATGNSVTLSNIGQYRTGLVTLNVTAASGTTPTLNVKLQASDDNGTTWYDLPNGAFTQLTTTGQQVLQIGGNASFGDTLRAAWTIGGTTPSFTFAVKMVAKS